MSTITEGTLLWTPSESVKGKANITSYMAWLEKERRLKFQSYSELWEWSVTALGDFWESIWGYFDVKASQGYSSVLEDKKMPGANWFANAEINYAEHIFRNATDERPALLYKTEGELLREMSWQDLLDKTNIIAGYLKTLGVERGDRVAAYMPNIPESIIAFLACASLGAIWSSCSPDFGVPSVLDRFQQIKPKVLIAFDGYHWNGKIIDRYQAIAELQLALPSLEKTILVMRLSDNNRAKLDSNTILWDQVISTVSFTLSLEYEQVPFSHPLWVLYSSGTTGLPKPIVQGQGGILLEHLKALILHLDLKPDDRIFWYTSTGWMMWNFIVGGLLAGATVILYDGSPNYPDLNTLWRLAEETRMTYFGTSAAYISACLNAGIKPGNQYDLAHLRAVGSTGSPLSVDGFVWVYENVGNELALESISGGTDLCTAFLGGCRLLPVRAGEIQCRCLGAKVEAFDDDGASIINKVGELVITEPMPSMPLFFWNDPDGSRYQTSYFEMFPGVWQHGDWIKINHHDSCVVYGRSDSTIKRHGVRMGTSEIYQAVSAVDGVVDSLVVDLEMLGQKSYMPLFIVLQEGIKLDDQLIAKIKQKIRQDISPRHVPNEIFAIDEVPRTLSGKKMEVPIRKILLGFPVEESINLGAMRNPESIKFFLELAAQIQKRQSI